MYEIQTRMMMVRKREIFSWMKKWLKVFIGTFYCRPSHRRIKGLAGYPSQDGDDDSGDQDDGDDDDDDDDDDDGDDNDDDNDWDDQ